MNGSVFLASAFATMISEYLYLRRRTRIEMVATATRAILVAAFLGYIMQGQEPLNPLVFVVIMAHEASRPVENALVVLISKLRVMRFLPKEIL